MIRRFLAALGAIAVLLGAPVAAQDLAEAVTEAEEAVREGARRLFPPEPLTPEQEARLPAAQALAEIILPPGTFDAVMAKSLRTTMRPLLQMAVLGKADTTFVRERLGLSAEQWTSLPNSSKVELANLLDPAFGQRARADLAAVFETLKPVSATIEPYVRQAIVAMHAQQFTEAQMTDIGAFFATPTGAIYAEQWLSTMFDPRLFAVNMELTSRMISFGVQAQARMTTDTGLVGTERAYSDLSEAERDRVAEIVGMDRAALEQQVAAAADEPTP